MAKSTELPETGFVRLSTILSIILRGRGVLQETLVETSMFDPATLPADVAILDVNLRGLREARELLMGRLRRDDSGRFVIQAAPSRSAEDRRSFFLRLEGWTFVR